MLILLFDGYEVVLLVLPEDGDTYVWEYDGYSYSSSTYYNSYNSYSKSMSVSNGCYSTSCHYFSKVAKFNWCCYYTYSGCYSTTTSTNCDCMVAQASTRLVQYSAPCGDSNYRITTSTSATSYGYRLPVCQRDTIEICNIPLITNGDYSMYTRTYVLDSVVDDASDNIATFACVDGYALSDDRTLTCLSAETFDQDPPTCHKKCDVPTIENGYTSVDGSVDVVHTTPITYGCDTGYWLNGTSSAECNEGSWTEIIPNCVIYVCEVAAVDNADVSISAGTVVDYGTSITYTCNAPEYMTDDATSMTCLEGTAPDGTWDKSVPLCYLTPICDVPTPEPDMTHDQISRTFVYYQEVITFDCIDYDNYYMVGTQALTCQYDTTLSTDVPVCDVRLCKDGWDVIASDGVFCYKDLGTTADYDTSDGQCTTEGGRLPYLADATAADHFNTAVTRAYSYQVFLGTKYTSADSSWHWEYDDAILDENTYTPLSGELISLYTPEECVKDEVAPLTSIKSLYWESTACSNSLQVVCQQSVNAVCEIPRIDNADHTIYNDEVIVNVGEQVSFVCLEGFALTHNDSITCVDWEKYDIDLPICYAICAVESIQYGISNYDGYATAIHGKMIEYECDEGHGMFGSQNATCDDGAWTSKAPRCSIYSCTIPIIEHQNETFYEGETVVVYNETVAFECNDGYALDNASHIIRCVHNETYDSEPPICYKTCETPVIVDGSTSGDHLPEIEHTDSIDFYCDEGHWMKGSNTSTCNEGTWEPDPPLCFIYECSVTVIDNADTSIYNGDMDRVYNETVEFACADGYTLDSPYRSLRCIFNETYDKDPPFCDKMCMVPNPIDNGESDVDIYARVVHNTTATFSCNEGYWLNGSDTSTCVQGSWTTEPPVCVIYYCGIPVVANAEPFRSYDLDYDRTTTTTTTTMATTTTTVLTTSTTILASTDENTGSTSASDSTSSPGSTESTSSGSTSTAGSTESTASTISSSTMSTSASSTGSTEPSTSTTSASTSATTPSARRKRETSSSSASTSTTSTQSSTSASTSSSAATESSSASSSTASESSSASTDATDSTLSTSPTSSTASSSGSTGSDSTAASTSASTTSEASTTTTEPTTTTTTEPQTTTTTEYVYDWTTHSLFEYKGIVYNETVRWECNYGYTIDEDRTLRCIHDDKFDLEQPYCYKMCDVPVVENGEIASAALAGYQSLRTNQTMVPHGAIVDVYCDTGYWRNGSLSTECVEGLYDPVVPNCVIHLCDILDLDNAAVIVPELYTGNGGNQSTITFNQIVEYDCNDGYTMNGVSVMRCSGNNTWATDFPVCDKQCVVEAPEFGMSSLDGTELADHQDTISYICEDTHWLSGFDKATCEQGVWSNELPTCIAYDQETTQAPVSMICETITFGTFSYLKCTAVTTTEAPPCEPSYVLGVEISTCPTTTMSTSPKTTTEYECISYSVLGTDFYECPASPTTTDAFTGTTTVCEVVNVFGNDLTVCYDGQTTTAPTTTTTTGPTTTTLPTTTLEPGCEYITVFGSDILVCVSNETTTAASTSTAASTTTTAAPTLPPGCTYENILGLEIEVCGNETNTTTAAPTTTTAVPTTTISPGCAIEYILGIEVLVCGTEMTTTRVITTTTEATTTSTCQVILMDACDPAFARRKRATDMCTVPSVPNANVTSISKNIVDGTIEIDGSLTFSCHENYTMFGNASIDCVSNETFDGYAPFCGNASDTCTVPTVENGYTEEDGELEFGQSVLINCNETYVINGIANITCVGNDTFNFDLPLCVAESTTASSTSSTTTATTTEDTGTTTDYTGSTTDSTDSTTEYTGSTTEYTGSTTDNTASTTEYTGSTTEYTGSTTDTTESTTEYTGSTTEYTGSTTDYTGSTTESTGSTTDNTGSTTAYTGSTTEYTGSTTDYTGSTTDNTGSTTDNTGTTTEYTGSTTAYTGSTTDNTASTTAYTGSTTAYTGSTTEDNSTTLLTMPPTMPTTEEGCPNVLVEICPTTTPEPTVPPGCTYEYVLDQEVLVCGEETTEPPETTLYVPPGCEAVIIMGQWHVICGNETFTTTTEGTTLPSGCEKAFIMGQEMLICGNETFTLPPTTTPLPTLPPGCEQINIMGEPHIVCGNETFTVPPIPETTTAMNVSDGCFEVQLGEREMHYCSDDANLTEANCVDFSVNETAMSYCPHNQSYVPGSCAEFKVGERELVYCPEGVEQSEEKTAEENEDEGCMTFVVGEREMVYCAKDTYVLPDGCTAYMDGDEEVKYCPPPPPEVPVQSVGECATFTVGERELVYCPEGVTMAPVTAPPAEMKCVEFKVGEREMVHCSNLTAATNNAKNEECTKQSVNGKDVVYCPDSNVISAVTPMPVDDVTYESSGVTKCVNMKVGEREMVYCGKGEPVGLENNPHFESENDHCVVSEMPGDTDISLCDVAATEAFGELEVPETTWDKKEGCLYFDVADEKLEYCDDDNSVTATAGNAAASTSNLKDGCFEFKVGQREMKLCGEDKKRRRRQN